VLEPGKNGCISGYAYRQHLRNTYYRVGIWDDIKSDLAKIEIGD
jgi:hypothetical protein